MAENFYCGIDVGTSFTKAVIVNKKQEIVSKYIERTGSDLEKSINKIITTLSSPIDISKKDIVQITATGFGRRNVPYANNVITEISSHAKGAFHFFPQKITIIDIGGQDTKIIKLDDKGKIIGFKMNRKCAAGTGSFLEEISFKLNIPLNKIDKLASKSIKDTALNSFCTVFASTEIFTRIKEGEKVEDLLKSAFESVIKRVIELDVFEGDIVCTGGVVKYNTIIKKILAKNIGKKVHTPPDPQINGAFGAALYAQETKI
jgi:predicted CoA-substrate-specific enzyme activase